MIRSSKHIMSVLILMEKLTIVFFATIEKLGILIEGLISSRAHSS